MFDGARLRLTAWYVGALATILVVAGLVTYVTLARSLRVEADDSLRDRSRSEIERLQQSELFSPGGPDDDDSSDSTPGASGPAYDPGTADILVFVTSGDGKVLEKPEPPWPSDLPSPALVEEARATKLSQLRSVEADDVHFRVMTVPLLRDGEIVGFLQLAKSEAQHKAELDQLRTVLAIVASGGVALAALGGFVLTGRTLAPIRRALQRQRDFVADASHELRTPLTVIRANIEVALRGADEDQRGLLEDSLGDVDHMTTLVSDLLTIARIDAGTLAVAQDPVDLSALASEVCRGLEKVAVEGGRTFDSHIEPGIIVEGDGTRLRQLLTILTDNALRYNRDGGSVTVDIRRDRDRALVVVRDTGVGIPAESLPRVFDRFYRVDAARSSRAGGTGLGLSIAKWIVDAHRGRLRIESAMGVGTAVQVTLPVAKA